MLYAVSPKPEGAVEAMREPANLVVDHPSASTEKDYKGSTYCILLFEDGVDKGLLLESCLHC
jgi:hypothetical protein